MCGFWFYPEGKSLDFFWKKYNDYKAVPALSHPFVHSPTGYDQQGGPLKNNSKKITECFKPYHNVVQFYIVTALRCYLAQSALKAQGCPLFNNDGKLALCYCLRLLKGIGASLRLQIKIVRSTKEHKMVMRSITGFKVCGF